MDPGELIQWLSQIYGDDHSSDRKVAFNIDGKQVAQPSPH